METKLLSLLQVLLDYTLLFSLQLLVILLLRQPFSRFFGVVLSYRLWLFPVACLPFTLIDWQALTTSSLFMAERTVSASLPGQSSSAMQAGLENFAALLSLNFSLPDLVLGARNTAWRNVWAGVGVMWLTGVCFFLFKYLGQIVRMLRYVRQEAVLVTHESPLSAEILAVFPAGIRAYRMPGLRSPALFGVFRPYLLLPINFGDSASAAHRRLMLGHEAKHYQRRDNLWNFLVCLLQIIFWFNPVMHVAHRYFRLDQELSCDALTLAQENVPERRHYAEAILGSVQRENLINMTALTGWGSFQDCKTRLEMIAHHHALKPRQKASVVTFIVLFLMGGVLSACYSTSDNTPQPPADAQVISRPVFERLRTVMELRDADDVEGAMAVMSELRGMYERGELSTVETLRMWQFFYSIAAASRNWEEAISYQQRILGLSEPVTANQREDALYAIGQLSFALEEYQQSIDYYRAYLAAASKPDIGAYQSMAYAYYSMEDYQAALPNILRYREMLEASDEEFSQSNFQFLRSIYLITEDFESAAELTEEMIDRFGETEDSEMLEQLQERRSSSTPGQLL